MEISPMPSSAFQFTPTPNTGLPFSSGEGATHSLECHKATWLQQKKAVVASRDLVGYSPLTLLVPTHGYLPSSMSNTLPISQLQATLLPTPDEGEPHDCVDELSISCSPRPDLSDQPVLNLDLLLFVDGSASRDPASGRCQAGYAICDSHGVLESASLPSHYSATSC
ncbi:uncharacterized protein isoform X3 [Takifugu rubripes]|uniref:uncharacterized protein isoform X3 n=1 Tax=Takifugu rubripes TaxID=31033 RepID=UPI0011459815|nr:uncharacterized protein LOC115250251 isoform X3 [Takifugu rubripes]XP_029693965.1 uncharacterized protein LOC115250251 isoform X3 [Takifugu rubripes]